MSNRVQLSDIASGDVSAASLADLSAEELKMLQDDLDEEKARARNVAAVLKEALRLKYAAKIKRTSPFGSAKCADGEYAVSHEVKKEVKWNQDAMAAACAEADAKGIDPAEYVKWEYSIPEKTFGAMPAAVKAIFEPARTVTPGTESFVIKQKESK